VLAKLIHRPQPPHRPTPSSLGTGGYGLEADLVISDGQNAQLRGHWASTWVDVGTLKNVTTDITDEQTLLTNGNLLAA
jgi:hypothetical protein